MLAVHPEARRRGLAKRLKLYQRELLLQHGIAVASWSFDPLVAANANLNLNGLGAVPVEYVVNMYGDTGSVLHHSLDTDRFVVDWRLVDPRVESLLAGRAPPLPPEALTAPTVNPDALTAEVPHAQNLLLPNAPWVRVAVPLDIETIKATSPDDARLWQLATRRAFEWYLGQGYSVVGFYPAYDQDRAFYVLTRSTPGGEPCHSESRGSRYGKYD